MDVHFYSPVHFEKWDYTTSDGRGIGGSETAHIELAWRFARRGYGVHSYAPIPARLKSEWRGTNWKSLKAANFNQDGLWVIFRDAACLDEFTPNANRRAWLMCQDEAPRNITPERAEKLEKVIALCQWHKRHLERNWPELQGKVVVSSNGIKTDLIRKVEAGGIPDRNPKRMIYASSPDRGLLPLLKIFKRVREFVPDAELHCFYGLNNINKLVKWNKRFNYYKGFVTELKEELKQPGVFWHGRVSQKQLTLEWLKSGLWVYPCSAFSETSCITCMEAQALGAIPVFSPRAALAENITNGVVVDGDAHHDALVQNSFVAEIVKLMWYPQIQNDLRALSMPHARAQFAWDRIVDQWESWLNGWDGFFYAQYAFQLKHAVGRVLNVGCADDPAGLGRRGTNLDASTTVPWSGKPTAAHVIHDARKPFPKSLGHYDTVILGDILEHLTDADAVKMLKNCRQVLEPKGHIVITCPEDYRKPENQHRSTEYKYLPGESAYHERPITSGIINDWLAKAALKKVRHYAIDYAHFEGHGVVARRTK